MRPKVETPAFFSLIVFLAINYLVGYGVGHVLTGSILWSVAIALVTPCLTLFVYAVLTGRRAHARAQSDGVERV
jgi:uncharacterized membrane protein